MRQLSIREQRAWVLTTKGHYTALTKSPYSMVSNNKLVLKGKCMENKTLF